MDNESPSKMLVTRAPNTRDSAEQTAAIVLDRLTRATAALAEVVRRRPRDLDATAVEGTPENVEALRVAHEAVENVRWYLPHVRVWCVVKHYADKGWTPAPWWGFTSEEQARAWAAYMQAVSDEEASRKGWTRDRYVAEMAEIAIQQVAAPDAAPPPTYNVKLTRRTP